MSVVQLDRRLAVWTALLVLVLAWPLILFGHPNYTDDSPSYFKGGKVAVIFVIKNISSLYRAATFQPSSSPVSSEVSQGATPEAPSVDDVVGARSILYSAAAYLLRAPHGTMILWVLAQVAATALTITVVALALGVTEFLKFIALAISVAVATPVAIFANSFMPDIFAGILICIIALLTTRFDQLSLGVRIVLVTVGGFAVASHASLPPLAAGMGLIGAGYTVLTSSRARRRLPTIAWPFAPLALGLAATIVSGFIGFHELSFAPKRFPLTLARSVADGPARWYLQKNCATRRYAVCEVFGSDIPHSVNKFLWAKGGLRYRATPEQMDRIRAEEAEIVLLAAISYPSAQAALLTTNIGRQLIHIGLRGLHFNQRLLFDPAGKPYVQHLDDDEYGLLFFIVHILTIISILLGASWAIWRFSLLKDADQATLLLVASGIIGNAIICAVFAGVTDRYQGRVIWVLPMVCMAIILSLPRPLRTKGN